MNKYLEIKHLHKTLAFQCMPSRRGIYSNEQADYLTKKIIKQSAKNMINLISKTFFRDRILTGLQH